MGSQQRELEVTVLSARDLKNVNLWGAMDPYCVAWLYPHDKVSGPVNKGGGVHPTWNAIITLVADEALLQQGDAAVTVEVYNHGKFSGNKLIGSATVPLADTVQGKAGAGSTKAAAYPVRKKSGKQKGVINVAIKVGKVLSDAEVQARSAPAMGVPQQQYYPQQGQQQFYPQQGQYSQAGYQQQQQPRRGGGFGGAGMGLGAGLLGGVLLGSALDGGFGGDGGGGCGGGGGGCGGGGGGCGGG